MCGFRRILWIMNRNGLEKGRNIFQLYGRCWPYHCCNAKWHCHWNTVQYKRPEFQVSPIFWCRLSIHHSFSRVLFYYFYATMEDVNNQRQVIKMAVLNTLTNGTFITEHWHKLPLLNHLHISKRMSKDSKRPMKNIIPFAWLGRMDLIPCTC